MSASQRAHFCIITTHNAGAILNVDGGNQAQKNFSISCPGLSSDLVQKYLTKINQPYLGNFNNQEKAYDQHSKKYSR